MAKDRTRETETLLGEASSPVRVRVLTDCRFGRADSVALVDSEELLQAKDLGLVDDHPDAVAYAAALVV